MCYVWQAEGRKVLKQLVRILSHRPNSFVASNNRFLQAISALIQALNTELSSEECDSQITTFLQSLRVGPNALTEENFQALMQSMGPELAGKVHMMIGNLRGYESSSPGPLAPIQDILYRQQGFQT